MKRNNNEVILTNLIKARLMPDLKMIRLSNKNDYNFVQQLKENNIKGTILGYHLPEIMIFIIFDTNEDFMLFKLKFGDIINKEFRELRKYGWLSYEEFKERQIYYMKTLENLEYEMF